MEKGNFFSARRIAWFAILLTLVIVLQIWGSAIPFAGTTLNLTLIPVVLGAIILGPIAGMLLGIAVGVIISINAFVGTDAFTLFLYQNSPVMTFLIIFVKGSLAGFVPGVVFKALKGKPLLATFIASGLAPVVNTGVFIIGALIISGTIGGFMNMAGITGQSVIYFVIIGCAGINFLVEFAINMILAPALHRVIKVIDKSTGILPKEQVEENLDIDKE